ncbi:ClpP/crotonase [Aspergillus uvarum CBS 121591]|uniref:methylcrotonoyl-CoA carboxylase n=1 Tax=Aspergillus uvarum CBS 121591 TaxID=1448315 RepID=A0A319C6U4_9EURO|nr:ClpP/crotonase [Aspergillus uvarum CBS 121591]PYH80934.1 ClpP/crotonase [Aspergillus uvarum CBS 121591]
MATQFSFPPLPFQIDLNHSQYRANQETWKTVLDRFERALQQVAAEARNFIALLLDQDSPILEIGAFAGYRNPNSTPCANLIAGIGNVSGQPCLLMSHIPTQSGGAWNEMTGRCLPPATIPSLSFHKGGQLFRDLTVRTKHGKSSCALVFGSSTAGGAYHPALSDHTVFVENQGQAFLAGPPLVRMATGEVIGAEELGGARVHATKTGLADQIAADELDAIRKAREWVATLHIPSPKAPIDTIEPLPPRYPVHDLPSLVNPDIRKSFEMREVLLRLIDDSRLLAF